MDFIVAVIIKESNISGYLLVNQVKKYDDKESRLKIAREIIKAASHNIYRNLRYYNSRGIELNEPIKQIQSLINSLDYATSINGLMGIEGNIRKVYYSA